MIENIEDSLRAPRIQLDVEGLLHHPPFDKLPREKASSTYWRPVIIVSLLEFPS